MTSLPALRHPGSMEAKRGLLRRNKRRATGLLLAATAVFVASVVARRSSDAGWLEYLQATAEAAMVGGLADWFAVTALFRHPLGIPIPHTAIVPERKEQFAATLGEFVQDSFLTPEVVAARIRSAGIGARAASWAAEPANADRLARTILDAASTATDLVEDDAVHRLVEDLVTERVRTLPIAPLAGRALDAAVREGRHHELLAQGLLGLDRIVGEHHDDLQRLASGKAPWWLPGAVEDRIFERLLAGARLLLHDLATQPAHPLRADIDRRLADFAEALQTSPEVGEKVQQLVLRALDEGALRSFVASMWEEAKAGLRAQVGDPGAPLRARLAAAIASGAERVTTEPALTARIDDGIDAAARYAVDHLGHEVVDLITATIGRWDAAETTDRLELLLGPDLQYIRINGTLVGGAAGLALHAVAALLG